MASILSQTHALKILVSFTILVNGCENSLMSQKSTLQMHKKMNNSYQIIVSYLAEFVTQVKEKKSSCSEWLLCS